jgi:hypothetical protein
LWLFETGHCCVKAAGPLAAADDAVSRLDERLRASPIRDGWIARTHFLDACASAGIDGALVFGMVISVTGHFWGPAAETMVYVVMAVVLIIKPVEV